MSRLLSMLSRSGSATISWSRDFEPASSEASWAARSRHVLEVQFEPLLLALPIEGGAVAGPFTVRLESLELYETGACLRFLVTAIPPMRCLECQAWQWHVSDEVRGSYDVVGLGEGDMGGWRGEVWFRPSPLSGTRLHFTSTPSDAGPPGLDFVVLR